MRGSAGTVVWMLFNERLSDPGQGHPAKLFDRRDNSINVAPWTNFSMSS